MAKHRSYSIEFERQVAQEYLGGETLHGLAKRHDISRDLIRITRPAPSTATWLSPIYKQTNEFPENLSRLAPWVRDVANLSARNVYAFRENQHCP
jgi:hypothetical protein